MTRRTVVLLAAVAVGCLAAWFCRSPAGSEAQRHGLQLRFVSNEGAGVPGVKVFQSRDEPSVTYDESFAMAISGVDGRVHLRGAPAPFVGTAYLAGYSPMIVDARSDMLEAMQLKAASRLAVVCESREGSALPNAVIAVTTDIDNDSLVLDARPAYGNPQSRHPRWIEVADAHGRAEFASLPRGKVYVTAVGQHAFATRRSVELSASHWLKLTFDRTFGAVARLPDDVPASEWVFQRPLLPSVPASLGRPLHDHDNSGCRLFLTGRHPDCGVFLPALPGIEQQVIRAYAVAGSQQLYSGDVFLLPTADISEPVYIDKFSGEAGWVIIRLFSGKHELVNVPLSANSDAERLSWPLRSGTPRIMPCGRYDIVCLDPFISHIWSGIPGSVMVAPSNTQELPLQETYRLMEQLSSVSVSVRCSKKSPSYVGYINVFVDGHGKFGWTGLKDGSDSLPLFCPVGRHEAWVSSLTHKGIVPKSVVLNVQHGQVGQVVVDIDVPGKE